MAGRVLCIELGAALTKVCEMDYGKSNPSVYDSFMFETPEGTMEDGYIKSVDAFGEKFKKELSAHNIETNKLIFAVYSNKIATREATIPLVKNDKILPMVEANASDYFPIDLTGYQLGYTILDKVNTKEEKTLKLSVVAAPKDMLESYLTLANSLGMQLVDIDFAGNSIFQAIKDTTAGVQASIHMNEYSTLISIIDNGKMTMQRSIAYGVFGAIEAVMGLPENNTKAGFNVMDAIDVLSTKPYIDSEFSQGGGYSAGMSAGTNSGNSAIVTESLRYLVGNVARVIDYYLSKNQGAEIGELKLTGLGSQFRGINELFANEIGIKTREIIAIPSVSFERVGMGSMIPVMLLAIGANLSPMGLVPDEIAKVKAETKKQGSFVLGLIILIFALGASGGLFVLGTIQLAAATLVYNNSIAEESEKAPIESKFQQYQDLKTVYDQYMEFYKTTDNNNEQLGLFITELEDKMPATIKMTKLDATADGVLLEFEVPSKEEAADVIRTLGTFQTIQVASAQSSEIVAEETVDDEEATANREEVADGSSAAAEVLYDSVENKVSLTVVCTYYVEPETTEAVPVMETTEEVSK